MSILGFSSSASTLISTSRRTSRRIFKRSRPWPGDSTSPACSCWSCCCPTLPSTSSHDARKMFLRRSISTRRSSNSAGSLNRSLNKSLIRPRQTFITLNAHDVSEACKSKPSEPKEAADSAIVSVYSSRSMVAFRTTVGVNRRSIPIRILSGRLCASSTMTMMSERSTSIALSDASRTASTKR